MDGDGLRRLALVTDSWARRYNAPTTVSSRLATIPYCPQWTSCRPRVYGSNLDDQHGDLVLNVLFDPPSIHRDVNPLPTAFGHAYV
jgi:hypothetical protein